MSQERALDGYALPSIWPNIKAPRCPLPAIFSFLIGTPGVADADLIQAEMFLAILTVTRVRRESVLLQPELDDVATEALVAGFG